MLESPDIPDSRIIACLRDEFGLHTDEVHFLPVGADKNTAVFRAMTDTASYFVKLRSGIFDEMSIVIPKLLHEQHMTSVIAPLSALSRLLWAALDDFKVMVFPFIEGHNAYETHLLDRHWVELGQALKALHTANLSVKNHIQRECYTDHWRQQVRQFQRLTEEKLFDDPVAAELAAFLKQKKAVVDDLIHRAERLAAVLRSEPLPFTLCHADIHAGNVLIDLHQHLYLIDWDTLILAPKERDLMFVGAGLFLNQRSAEEETRLFYQGYGQTEVNSDALAYYRYERIVQDIAAYCEQLLLTTEGGQDRENGLRQLMSQFQPGGVVEMAFK